jgi:oligopeptide/dipeptide ABC transporter ATP-binding protein
MYLGRIVELANTVDLFTAPLHPYTEALFSAVPQVDATARRTRIILAGDMPSAVNPPSGCPFRTRCRYAIATCAQEVPLLRQISARHWKACIRDDLKLLPAVAPQAGAPHDVKAV